MHLLVQSCVWSWSQAFVKLAEESSGADGVVRTQNLLCRTGVVDMVFQQVRHSMDRGDCRVWRV